MDTRLSRLVLTIALGIVGFSVQAGPAYATPNHPTRTTVTCTPTTVTVDGSTICTAVVMDVASMGMGHMRVTPTGTVTWASSGPGTFSSSVCTLSGSGSSASCSVTYTPTAVGTGSHTITATYLGSPPQHVGSSGSTMVTVIRRSTSTSVSCTPGTIPIGATTSCTATVTDTQSGGTKSPPAGTVSFSSNKGGAFVTPSCTLAAAGTDKSSCTVSFAPTEEGTHTITASYGGSPTHASSSGTTTVTVTKRTTKTEVSCTPATLPIGATTSCTATVTDIGSGTTSPPQGTVSFSSNKDGAFVTPSCTLVAAGTDKSSCTVSFAPTEEGTHTITASYGGSPTHASSSGTTTVTVTKRTTKTEVSCTPDSLEAGDPTSCTATVTDTQSGGTKSPPAGLVSFSSNKDGAFVTPSCTLVAAGLDKSSCMVTYTPTEAALHTITASYGGSPTHASSSGTTTVTVTPGDPAFLTLAPSPGHSAVNEVNSNHCETATVTDAFGNPTPNITVIFSVTGVNPGDGSDTTDPNGEAEFCYIGLLFGPDAIHAFADTDGDGEQDLGEPFGDASKVWTLPVSTPLCEVEFPTGGGHFHADNGDFANFGGNAHVSETGDPTGQQEYRDHGPVQPLDVHSINVLAVVCIAIDGGKQATLYGEATIDGSGTYAYRIQVEDLSQGGSMDTYWILLSNGYNSGRHTLEGGNITIH